MSGGTARSAPRQPGERGTVDNANPLAAEIDPASVLEAAQQARHNLADAAQLVSKGLMCRVNLAVIRVAIEQECGKPLVELLAGDRFDDLHQLRQSLAEQRKHMSAERFVLRDQCFERRRRQDEHLDVGVGNGRRCVWRMPQQAAA